MGKQSKTLKIKITKKKSKPYLLKQEKSSSEVSEPFFPMGLPVTENLKARNKPVRICSLFTGCGGMDLGFEGGFIVHKNCINENTNPDFIDSHINSNFVRLKPTNMQTVFANDILKEAHVAWVNNFTKFGYDPNLFHTDSIVDLVKMHKAGASVFPEKIDIVTGGFPCQDFSLAGKRNGFNSHKDHNGQYIKETVPAAETRGQLYFWMKEVVEITKPLIFIAENVKGLVNLSDVKDVIQSDFSTAGDNAYIVLDPRVLHAADYGVPQSRERVIFIGIRKSALTKNALKALSKPQIPIEYCPYPLPSHSYTNKYPELKKTQTLKHILSSLVEPENSTDLSHKFYSKAKYMGTHCQGQTEVNMNGIGPTIRAEHHGNIEYRRLSKENGGANIAELKLGLKERRLTPRECALIQTFPPDFDFVKLKSNSSTKFSLSASGAYKVIGNAVPPLLAYHIAKRIENLWKLYFGVEL